MQTKTIDVSGLSVETTDQGEKAIRKLQGEVTAATDLLDSEKAAHDAALQTAADDHKKAIDKKDAELATKDSEIAELEKKVLTGDDLDKLVADRLVMTLISKASQTLQLKRWLLPKFAAKISPKTSQKLTSMLLTTCWMCQKAIQCVTRCLTSAKINQLTTTVRASMKNALPLVEQELNNNACTNHI